MNTNYISQQHKMDFLEHKLGQLPIGTIHYKFLYYIIIKQLCITIPVEIYVKKYTK